MQHQEDDLYAYYQQLIANEHYDPSNNLQTTPQQHYPGSISSNIDNFNLQETRSNLNYLDETELMYADYFDQNFLETVINRQDTSHHYHSSHLYPPPPPPQTPPPPPPSSPPLPRHPPHAFHPPEDYKLSNKSRPEDRMNFVDSHPYDRR